MSAKRYHTKSIEYRLFEHDHLHISNNLFLFSFLNTVDKGSTYHVTLGVEQLDRFAILRLFIQFGQTDGRAGNEFADHIE